MKFFFNNVVFVSVAISLVLLLPACWSDANVSTNNQALANKNLVIINLLEKEYYDDCAIAGSVNVELDDLVKFVESLNKKTEIVVYCSNYMCTASAAAWKILTKMGFENVWAYEGGTAEWYQLGLPVTGACKQAYLTKKNVKPAHASEDESIKTITAQELQAKIEQQK